MDGSLPTAKKEGERAENETYQIEEEDKRKNNNF